MAATVIKTFICPADALANPPVAQLLAPFPGFPDGIYNSLASYGPNTGTRGWATFTPPQIDDGVFLVWNSTRPVCLANITDGTSSTILFGEAYHRDPLWKTLSDKCMSAFGLMNQDDLGKLPAWILYDAVARNALAPINSQLTPSEVAGPLIPWSPPCRDLTYKRLGAYGSGHGGGANVVFADGSVRFLSDSLSLRTLQALSTRAGGEVITEDY